ncbi:endonuclease YncB(thermonuclease family) [Roseimicrobium gellanilyticum]|uniref:Endonuclease YncB(Thermonuclease family) n=1 Tax=Roseimicrobium gellanilyticum TaxID=748857 RepID=A0A366HWS3_9BACT|nr:thermonuclease family protein [Roseimicrobium gellanilyticum]RBP47935.1 endonuclease YncB(thermonuclease family) [Roseimicrobium gellanilyticum]
MLQKTVVRLMLMLTIVWSAACTGSTTTRPERASPGGAEAADLGFESITRPAAQHRVVRVSDGDTVTLVSDGVTHKARLSGIDAPEMSQDYGNAARDALAAMVRGKAVTFTDSGQDRYQRTLVHLYVDGIDVNLQLVRQGMAWQYRAYSNDPGLAAAEQEARANRRGLWAKPNPVPPWDWRRLR